MSTWQDFVVPPDEDPGKKEKKDKSPTKKTTAIEGSLRVLPDCRYAAGQSHNLQGIGKVFNGLYKAKRVVHRITSSGYEVEITERRVLAVSYTAGSKDDEDKKSGTGSGSGSGAEADNSRRSKVTPNKAKEEDYIIVDKRTGNTSRPGSSSGPMPF